VDPTAYNSFSLLHTVLKLDADPFSWMKTTAVAQPGGNSMPKLGLDTGMVWLGLLIRILLRALGLFPTGLTAKYGFAEGAATKFEFWFGEGEGRLGVGNVNENSTRKRTGLGFEMVSSSAVGSSIRHLSGPAQSPRLIPLLKPPPSTITPSRSRSLPMSARVLETSSEEYRTPPCPLA